MSEQARSRTYTWADPLASAAEGMKMSGLDYMQAVAAGRVNPPPIMHTMGVGGIELVEFGKVIFFAIPEEFHYNPIGMVHGGFACTLLDSALACAVQTTLPLGMAYTSLEIKINFVRAITKDTGRIRAIGTVVHPGRQVATAEGRLLDENDKLYAHASTTCLIFPLPS